MSRFVWNLNYGNSTGDKFVSFRSFSLSLLFLFFSSSANLDTRSYKMQIKYLTAVAALLASASAIGDVSIAAV